MRIAVSVTDDEKFTSTLWKGSEISYLRVRW